jgi:hypothetical protein
MTAAELLIAQGGAVHIAKEPAALFDSVT